jgi:ketosteroid isomerase-like protein
LAGVAELTRDAAVALFDRRRVAWLAEDVEGYLACFTPGLVITVPGRAEPLRGADRYERLVRRSFAWARPRSFAFHHVAVSSEGHVLAEWTISTQRRDDGGVSTWRGMSICALDDGRIAWWREYWDPAQLAAPG